MSNYDKEVSIVIPTYNRIELLEFTLLSLYEQSMPARNFEVIVVDDCSTDKTRKVLSKLKTPYRLKVLHNKTNKGAAHSRNQGIKASRGEIIIFLDEMLVDSDFIKGHLTYHKKEKMVVTTTFNGKFIYTHKYPGFTRKQKRECKNIVKKTGAGKYKSLKKGVTRLFHPDEVINHSVLQYGLTARSIYNQYYTLQDTYGLYLERMASPWFLFVTNGISLSREMLNQAGIFDEKFEGAWLEDWELGYRFYQAGAAFYNAPDIACYHQSHPIGTNNKSRVVNYLCFTEKFPEIEVLLVAAMTRPFRWSFVSWGNIVTQFKQLEKYVGAFYAEFITAFRDLAQDLRWYTAVKVNNQELHLLTSPEAGFSRWETAFAGKVKNQLEQLEQESHLSGTNFYLIKGFKDLLRLPLK